MMMDLNGLENKLLCLGLPSVVSGEYRQRHNAEAAAFQIS